MLEGSSSIWLVGLAGVVAVQAMALSALVWWLGRARRRRLRAEADLARLQAAQQASGQGCWQLALDHEGTWLLDERARVLLGWPDEVVAGIRPAMRRLAGRVHDQDLVYLQEALQACVADQQHHLDLRCRVRGEDLVSWRWVALCGEVYPADPARGQPRRIVGTISDVTDATATEMALKREAGVNRAMIRQAGEGICAFALDPDGAPRFSIWNQRMQALTGHGLERVNEEGWHRTLGPFNFTRLVSELTGHHHPSPGNGHAPPPKPDTTAADDAPSGPDQPQPQKPASQFTDRVGILPIIRADGQPRVLGVSLSPIYDGDETHFLAIVTDTTEAEADRQQHHAWAARQYQFNRLVTASEMGSGLAHQLNQPLAAISNYARGCRLRLDNGKLKVDECGEVMDLISDEALRAGQILHRLRRVVRVRHFERTESDLNEVAREAMQFCQPDLQQAGIRLSSQFEEKLPQVTLDRVLVQQAVINLVTNAREALESLDRPDRRVSVRTTTCGSAWVRLEVKDNGPGVPTDVLPSIFEPFVSQKASGIGIGLSLCRSIVEEHGGRINVDSHRGRGTRVVIDLPTVPA